MPVRIRRLRAPGDRAAITALWRSALPPAWPVLPDGIDRLDAGHVALDGASRVVGLAALDPAGSVQLVAVAPGHRRRGLGTELTRRALADLAAAEVAWAGVGSGGTAYFWPGVPTDLAAGRPFVELLGWTPTGTVHDLVRDLRRPAAAAPAPPAGVTLGLSDPEAADVQAFEAEHFPHWLRWFRGTAEEALVARGPGGAIEGTLLLGGPGRATMFWPLLGEDSASIGCVGVAPDRQSRGVGTAMVTHASDLLAARGAGWCHIAWTVRTRFYERAGYRQWRHYAMGRLPTGG